MKILNFIKNLYLMSFAVTIFLVCFTLTSLVAFILAISPLAVFLSNMLYLKYLFEIFHLLLY